MMKRCMYGLVIIVAALSSTVSQAENAVNLDAYKMESTLILKALNGDEEAKRALGNKSDQELGDRLVELTNTTLSLTPEPAEKEETQNTDDQPGAETTETDQVEGMPSVAVSHQENSSPEGQGATDKPAEGKKRGWFDWLKGSDSDVTQEDEEEPFKFMGGMGGR